LELIEAEGEYVLENVLGSAAQENAKMRVVNRGAVDGTEADVSAVGTAKPLYDVTVTPTVCQRNPATVPTSGKRRVVPTAPSGKAEKDSSDERQQCALARLVWSEHHCNRAVKRTDGRG
jgi:hypothetical protein